MKNSTIQDIADLAKVSKSTVSRVLNGTVPVHPDKRQAVLNAAEQLGFQPNFFARSLAIGRSMTIGVLTQNLGSPFYDAIAQGVIEQLEGSGYSPIFADGRWRTEVEREALSTLINRKIDGLVLIGGTIPTKELQETCSSLPRIVVARRLNSKQHSCLYVDNVEGGYLATEHLIELGHTRIAHLGGLSHHQDAMDRQKGYQNALSDAGISLDRKLVMQGDFSAEAGYESIRTLLNANRTFTGVFAANDMMAYGARLALHEKGLDVPGDVSIVGFDDQAESAFTTPPLTTVRQPAHELGREASSTLLEMIQGNKVRSKKFRTELKIRESVKLLS